MEYNKLMSVTGFSGLFELVSSKNDGAILKSLEDDTTKFISNRLHQFSHLESIEVYTNDENINLAEIFKAMDASTVALPSEKDNKAVRSYFEQVYPDMDFERVYNSDMKKMVRWFNVIKKHNIEIKLTEAPEESGEEG
jgi:Mg/Co/Ni transporter MgtE